MGFKENLRSELDYQDMIVKELSEKTGINKRSLDNYLTGHNSIPSADIAVTIAKALGVSVEYLVTGQETHSNGATSPKERKLLSLFEILDERDQQTVLTMVESMAERYANDGRKEKSSVQAG
ncbi:helix-turn-helix domain-containing protein [Treponema zuelzerae]|uniref:Helix-turn-helix domain-containing protein n=1 Tax=Teretinema zuelzerae TaxID=156 RepID=A0AAE3JHB9_9SPIR|nr:helix-turn-helix transcriptional regulator [Teretinema zuelzerae]MCD1653547.1 helix-turn-helix domain-containing protein [Teretinema zuelzerae]